MILRFRPIVLADFNLERSLDKSAAIAAIQILYPDSAEGATEYFRDRGPVIGGLFDDHVSYQVRRV